MPAEVAVHCRHINSAGLHTVAAQMASLQVLDLSDVPFTDQPLDLAALTSLRELSLLKVRRALPCGACFSAARASSCVCDAHL